MILFIDNLKNIGFILDVNLIRRRAQAEDGESTQEKEEEDEVKVPEALKVTNAVQDNIKGFKVWPKKKRKCFICGLQNEYGQ